MEWMKEPQHTTTPIDQKETQNMNRQRTANSAINPYSLYLSFDAKYEEKKKNKKKL